MLWDQAHTNFSNSRVGWLVFTYLCFAQTLRIQLEYPLHTACGKAEGAGAEGGGGGGGVYPSYPQHVSCLEGLQATMTFFVIHYTMISDHVLS